MALKKIRNNQALEKNKKILDRSLQELIAQKSSSKNALIKNGKLDAIEQALVINRSIHNLIYDAADFLNSSYKDEIAFFNDEEIWLREKCGLLAYEEGSWKWQLAQVNNDKRLARAAYENFLTANE